MDLQSKTPKAVTDIYLGRDAYYFIPTSNIHKDVLKSLDDSVVSRQSKSKLKCLVLDSQWLSVRNEEFWTPFLASLPCLKELRFCVDGDRLIRNKTAKWVPLKGPKEQVAIKLAKGVANFWGHDIQKYGPRYSSDYIKWGVEASSRQPPEITIWGPKPQNEQTWLKARL